MTEQSLFVGSLRPPLTIAGCQKRKNWIAGIMSNVSSDVAIRFRMFENLADFVDKDALPPDSLALIEFPLSGCSFEDFLAAITVVVGRKSHVLIGNTEKGSRQLDELRIAGAMCFEDNAHDFRRMARIVERLAALQKPRLIRWDAEIRQRLPWGFANRDDKSQKDPAI